MAKFIKSAFSPDDWINDDVTEVAVIGRSNAGKSSLINALSKSKIAITSKTPGRTQLANFFDFGDFRLVDLPGYGYAKVDKSKRSDIIKIISEVINIHKNIYMVVQIVDANVITAEDVAMSKFLDDSFVNHLIVCNKVDKGSLKHYLSKQDQIAKYLGVDKNKLMFISCKTHHNIANLHATIKKIISVVQ